MYQTSGSVVCVPNPLTCDVTHCDICDMCHNQLIATLHQKMAGWWIRSQTGHVTHRDMYDMCHAWPIPMLDQTMADWQVRFS